jgi:hypothetical protein
LYATHRGLGAIGAVESPHTTPETPDNAGRRNRFRYARADAKANASQL